MVQHLTECTSSPWSCFAGISSVRVWLAEGTNFIAGIAVRIGELIIYIDVFLFVGTLLHRQGVALHTRLDTEEGEKMRASLQMPEGSVNIENRSTSVCVLLFVDPQSPPCVMLTFDFDLAGNFCSNSMLWDHQQIVTQMCG
jgi:hypothetical protein